ncbi:SDR family NAD(P)-dependent oxidoreductase [Marinimicrobium sp. ABcell2]|uniref:SDR family NAD(P)-dependent oxidoreductase n=1 Tax=Marinimicrobium sp. ABcell2 TaxID=3069751 RepID=UPI0027B14CD3|nr:SDR family oxidoreductase [Marinimicrobium sp. ABcell2]MDQ2077101.1 SDR family oxidoreductase [Marinimicrobium sp. ABcell2]
MAEYTHYSSLRDRSVFITGGATGIGASLVEAFAAQGCRVAFVDIAEREGLALAADLEKRFGTTVAFSPCDVTKIDQLRGAIRTLSQVVGDITVLINNVANDTRYDSTKLSEATWYESLAVNLHPAFFSAQEVQPHMARQGGGAIINFSSINAMVGPAKLASYNTAKAAILGLSKSLARDFGPDNIRVNTIVPGWVATERQLKRWLTPEVEKKWLQNSCLNRRILPEDVAKLALFLASDDARMITSQKFIIDGGRI